MAAERGGLKSLGRGAAPAESGASVSDAGHPTARSLAQLESSQNAMRDTTRWLVAAAAAVGAVVVAGLQLSKIPAGGVATVLSIGGFILALAGVSLILFSAAGVLSAGYTTLGELADLRRTEDYRRQLQQARYWDKLIEPWGERAERFKKRPGEPGEPGERRKRRTPGEVLTRIAALVIGAVLNAIARARIRHAENEGVRIDDMLHYLNRDALFFSNGLAANMPQLCDQLEEADREILVLKGGQAPDGKQEPGRDDSRRLRSGFGRIVEWLRSALLQPVPPRPRPVDKLAESEWRQAHLELAAGQLVAFANQKLMEHKFSRLKMAVRIGGLTVAVGVGSFVLAPKFATETPLSITQPTPVFVQVTSNKFGPGCPRGMLLEGVAVGGTWQKPIVVTKAQGTCGARQVTLNSGQAIAVPQVSRSPTPTPS